jgi:hypothetical protein
MIAQPANQASRTGSLLCDTVLDRHWSSGTWQISDLVPKSFFFRGFEQASPEKAIIRYLDKLKPCTTVCHTWNAN